jgi:raffinose/stachyose/melibiose transport system substrate-binding protein
MALGLPLLATTLLGFSPIKHTESLPKLAYKGTITMYAQSYTPDVPGITLPAGSSKLSAFEDAAKAFEADYPGIHIKFIDSSTMGSTQWYETEAAAGNLPDVTWVQGTVADSTLPKGMFINLNPYFSKPNPYLPGNTAWKNIMNPRVLAITKAPNGAQYLVDGDWVGTAFYYNKRLFKTAGIVHAPATWLQLLNDCKKLEAHGIQPGANKANYGWFAAIFAANALGAKDLQKLVNYTPGSQGYISAYDQVMAYHSGLFNPAKNPRIMGWWPAMKALYSYWDKDVLDESPTANLPADAPSGETTFAAQKAAMTYQGSWLPSEIATLPKKQQFPVGSFNLQSLKGSSPYATKLFTGQDVGGPSAAFQYAIPSPAADHSLTPTKLKAVIAWMQFFSRPYWDQQIVNQLGSFVPTFKGTTPTKANRSLATDLTKPYYQLYPFNIVTTEAGDELPDVFQEYVAGYINFATAKQRFDTIAQTAVAQYVATNHVHF